MDASSLYEALMGPSYPRVKRYGTQGYSALRPGDTVSPRDMVEAGPGGATVNVEGYPSPQELGPNSLMTWAPFLAPPAAARPITSSAADYSRR